MDILGRVVQGYTIVACHPVSDYFVVLGKKNEVSYEIGNYWPISNEIVLTVHETDRKVAFDKFYARCAVADTSDDIWPMSESTKKYHKTDRSCQK